MWGSQQIQGLTLILWGVVGMDNGHITPDKFPRQTGKPQQT
jgi:hypothetical protein